MPRRKSYIEQAAVFGAVAKPKGFDSLPRLEKHYIRQAVKGAYDTARGKGDPHGAALMLAEETAQSTTRYYIQTCARYEQSRKCGAKTRKGTPCRCKPMPKKARCKFHGGASTGPRTLAGRIAALSCLKQYKARPDLLAARIEQIMGDARS
ncbi:MAG: HGGxSTG domain-containing protein [Alphaproteobacteria bacterium]